LLQQWQELDRLAARDPAAYRRHLEGLAREVGVALPSGFAERAESTAGAPMSRAIGPCLRCSCTAAVVQVCCAVCCPALACLSISQTSGA
jgi:hypothetical protein